MSEPLHSDRIQRIAGRIISYFETLGLGVIAIATLFAGLHEVRSMVEVGVVTLADLLLLFLYLEVLTMVAIYLESGSLPVRMPMYIAMVALARHLILDMKSMSESAIIATAAAILIIALAVLAIRFGHVRFPYEGNKPRGD